MKDKFHNLTNTKTKKILLTILTIIILNFFISAVTGVNLIAKAYNFITSLTSGYNSEIKNNDIKSQDYDSNKQGSYKISQEIEWTSQNTAHYKMNIESIVKNDTVDKNIIFVIDTSQTTNNTGFCNDDNLNYIKNISKEIISNNGTVTLITFNQSSIIEGKYIKDETTLENAFNTITCTNSNPEYNNYYAALNNISSILNEAPDKETIITFITDGYPNKETPNELGE